MKALSVQLKMQMAEPSRLPYPFPIWKAWNPSREIFFEGLKMEAQSGIINILYERARSIGENDQIPGSIFIRMALREVPWPIGPPDLLP